MSYSAWGKPPKSWIVSLTATLLVSGTSVSQCAETIRMARGFPISRPNPRRKSRAGTSSKGKVGAPWDTNKAGNMGAPQKSASETSACRRGFSTRRGQCGLKLRQRLLQPPARPHRLDARGQAFGPGRHEYAAQGGGAGGGGKTLRRHFARKALQGLGLVHADHRIVIGAGPGIGLVRRAAGQDLCVGGGNMLVGAHHQAGAAVAEMAHRHLLARRFGMDVHHNDIGAFA